MNLERFLFKKEIIFEIILQLFIVFLTRANGIGVSESCIPEDAHGVQRKLWKGLGYGSIERLRAFPKYPNEPTISDYITTMEAPQRRDEKFGQTLTAYFLARETGDHVFYIACDDQCQLFLSGNADPGNARIIIDVDSYTPYRVWEGRSSQVSKPITMTTGHLYYIHAIMAQNRGANHLSVGVRMPSGVPSRPMTSNYLLKYPLKDINSVRPLVAWAEWTSCNGSCKIGLETRSRFCLNEHFNSSIRTALYTQTQKRVCRLDIPCPTPPHQISAQMKDQSTTTITWQPFKFNASILKGYKLTFYKRLLIQRRKRTRRESLSQQSHVTSDDNSDVIVSIPRRKRRELSPETNTVFYYDVSREDQGSDVIIPPSYQSIVLRGLDAFTWYCIQMTTVTIYWESQPSTCVNVTTAEYIPSVPPTNVTAVNHTGSDTTLVTWSDIPDRAKNGRIQGYKVNICRLATANISVTESNNWTIVVNSSYMEAEVSGLTSFSLYEIRVAAFTAIGTGPYSEPVYAETCRCPKTLYTNWRNLSPYAINTRIPTGIFPKLLREVIDSICGSCGAYRRTIINYYRSNSNATFSPALKKNLNEFKNGVLSSDISFPLGVKKDTVQNSDYKFIPVVELGAGVVYINRKLSPEFFAKMVKSSIFQCWPILFIIMVMSLLAGTILCILEAISYPLRTCYKSSFLKGVYEYTWCCFISMSTVGYGDRYPRSIQGRIFSIIWFIVGWIIISIFVATLSSSLSVKIVIIAKDPVQGGQVGVVRRTPEHKTAMTINGTKGIKCIEYSTMDEMLDDLTNGTIDGILLDALSADNLDQDILPPSLFQVAKNFDLEMIYGIVLSRDAMKLEKLFREYIKKNPVKVTSNQQTSKRNTSMTAEIVAKPQTPTNPPKTVNEEETVINFFDPTNTMYQKAVFVVSGILVGLAICGLIYSHVTSRGKLKRKKKEELVHKQYQQFNEQDFLFEQRELLQAFYYRCQLLAEELRCKHAQEQLSLLKRLRKQSSRHYCLIPVQEPQSSSTNLDEKRTAIIIKHHRSFVENSSLETEL